MLLTDQRVTAVAEPEPVQKRAQTWLDSVPVDVPMVIDLDGTLITSNCFAETLCREFFVHPGLACSTLVRIGLGGIAAGKTYLAARVDFHPELLPYRAGLVARLRAERRRGRRLILATAAPAAFAHAVADHLQCFDDVLATDADRNLQGSCKLEAILHMVDGKPFIYCGNSRADFATFREASHPVFVGSSSRLPAVARAAGKAVHHEPARSRLILSCIRQARVHQWSKNALVLLPALTAYGMYEPARLAGLGIAALLMCVTASFIYLLNDWADLWADRAHLAKRFRPLASGALPAWAACLMMAVLGVMAVGLMVPLPAGARWLVVAYAGMNLLYTHWLKRVAVYDIILLSFLYVLRVVIGNEVLRLPQSVWFLTFLYLNFLNLAAWKRYLEFRTVHTTATAISRRGYHDGHAPLLLGAGMAAVFSACVVLIIYTTSHDVAIVYRHPVVLLLLGPLLLAHTLRMWFRTELKTVSHDPVMEMLRCKESWFLAPLGVAVVLAARW
jgi:4-hydroxybenzoate polyprenyltransferase